MLVRQMDLPPKSMVVAHFDHGMRMDSKFDRLFVEKLANKYDLPFVYGEGKLGSDASEATARQARYDFLHRVKQAQGARRIVTAHHHDDVLETAILNIMRGTGRKGMSSLKSTDGIFRPLLNTPKARLIEYAKEHGLQWREDSTNLDKKYLRNYIRHEILSRFDDESRTRLQELIREARQRNAEIDKLIEEQLAMQQGRSLDRHWFIMLPHSVAREIMAVWLSQADVSFDRKLIEQLTVAAKSALPGKKLDVNSQYYIHIGKSELQLTHRQDPAKL